MGGRPPLDLDVRLRFERMMSPAVRLGNSHIGGCFTWIPANDPTDRHRCYVYAVDAKSAVLLFGEMSSERKVLRKIAAANIRQARNSMGVSQEALAAEAGLHRTFIGHVERGRSNISIDNIEKIAAALNIEAYRLLIPQEAETPESAVAP